MIIHSHGHIQTQAHICSSYINLKYQQQLHIGIGIGSSQVCLLSSKQHKSPSLLVFAANVMALPMPSRRRRNFKNEQENLKPCFNNKIKIEIASSCLSAANSLNTTEPAPEPEPDNDGDGDRDRDRKTPELNTLFRRFWKVAAPYWFSDDKVQARLQLAAVFALTFATTGISVGFNFLGRDFYNALAGEYIYVFLLFIFFFFLNLFFRS